MHVLGIESTRYAVEIARCGDEILAGCRCGRCGGSQIGLTGIWVERGFQAFGVYRRISVLLARCKSCKARERVLPCDVVPGKVNSVGNIFGAVAAVRDGVSQTSAGARAGVSRQCVRLWIIGVGHRYLDLASMFRHRAMIAKADIPLPNRLVMFFAFVAQAKLTYPEKTWPGTAPPLHEAKNEAAKAAFAMVTSIEQATGGAIAMAAIGAALFRQAVLLFRSGGVVTPSCSCILGFSGQDDSQDLSDGDDEKEPKPQGNSLLALRADRRNACRWRLSKRAKQNSAAPEQSTCAMALRENKADPGDDRLPLDPRLQKRGARGPPAQTAL